MSKPTPQTTLLTFTQGKDRIEYILTQAEREWLVNELSTRCQDDEYLVSGVTRLVESLVKLPRPTTVQHTERTTD